MTLADADRTFTFVADLESRIARLTRADFDATLRKYLRMPELSSFVAGDFSKVK